MTETKLQRADIESLCVTSLEILSNYYEFNSLPKIKDFILPESADTLDSRVLFQENEDCVFIGVQFAKEIFNELKIIQKNTHSIYKNKFISLDSISVISEESSHFKIILDAVAEEKKISLVDIETIGEIDRFLCLMHWNYMSSTFKIGENFQNIHDICDCLFYGNRFRGENLELYIKAENRAFFHLKNAFGHEWDYTYYNFENVNMHAMQYFKKLRNIILYVR